MHNYFIGIHRLVQRNRLLSVFVALAILVFFGFLASKIKFEEDITRIIPKNDKADVTAKVLRQLNFSDKITVIIEKAPNGSVDDLAETADVFLDSIISCNAYIKDIQGKVDEENIQETFDFVYRNLPLFLEDNDYRQIAQKLNRDSIAAQVAKNYRTLISPTGIVAKKFIVNDPLGISFIALKKLQQLGVGDEFQLKNGYVVTKDESKLLLFLNPKLGGSETEKNTLFVTKLNGIKEQLNNQFKEKTTVDYFGSSLIAVANAKQIKSDIITTVLVSLGALMLILIVFYRKLQIPVIIFIPTLFGIAVAIASLVFLKGTISAISLSVGAVLLGVTIDYSLHIMTHYRYNSDVESLYKDITMPLIMSSSTTALAFLCLLFVHSEALKDLGIFAAISVMVSAVFSLLIIPHLYKPKATAAAEHQTFLDKAAGFSFENNKFLIIASVVVIVVSLFTFNKVQFNNNLSDLNFVPQEIKQAEAKLEDASNLTSKSIYLASYGNSMEEALQQNNKVYGQLSEKKAQKEILNFSSIGGIVLSKAAQEQKIAQWNAFWNNDRKDMVKTNLIAYGNSLGFKPETHQSFYDLLYQSFQPITFKEYKQLKALFLNEFVTEKNGFYTIMSVAKVSDVQRDAFVGSMAKEKEVITIDRQQMNETFLGKLRDDFNDLINYSFVAVVLILFVFFRRVELVIISTIPIVITGVVTAGVMYFFDIQLNIFSLIVCTLIFGHGVDFSIFMTSALQKEYTTGKNEMATYRTSILLAALTTVLAIGALIFARHPALKSISSVSLIGVFAALLITFIFYPILFRICFFNRVKKGKSPVSLRLLLHSTISFVYYGLGGILLSVIGRILVRVLPGNHEKKMLWFRKIMAKFLTSVLYSNPFVKKEVINKDNETFEKPCVVIANHTSFLDTLAIGMVTHKVVYLVNDWVYKSPIFGKAVQLMGYYPVSQGIEGGVDHLREKVEQGYSLMIFPEGSRSEDNVVKRFHKGAFYLAQEFNLDVVPVYIHGNSETIPKGDHIIYDENITVVVGKRIAAADTAFGTDYSERTKKINQHFREEFAALRVKLEDENYFRHKLYLSYLYKEPEIVQAVKTDFESRKGLYYEINQHIKDNARIIHFANDYGQLDFLLTMQQPKRKVVTFISDSEKRAIAASNYIVKKRTILYPDSASMQNEKHDTLLVSDKETITPEVLPITEQVKTIILISNFPLKMHFAALGFQTVTDEAALVVLKR
ncbi:1-acyl-sn-glycerol-3-phosphate acyltransferase [Flavobacterium suncheonense]|uniref:Glycerol acyltransferase n=1 Tax=Flavobacterium suncheonense GH29-5 = DSM 17707 TaxID=1121899 RepID=A0A0A2MBR8_9FLAO|nr:1-acyl-sn-glycerol-3-phosphate acyltransferase [Flavobacterium suncheonense]KGO89684.1 glycerol acyltransferase [Flavobacterium suncheonense GH29-5 = DSM 17707]